MCQGHEDGFQGLWILWFQVKHSGFLWVGGSGLSTSTASCSCVKRGSTSWTGNIPCGPKKVYGKWLEGCSIMFLLHALSIIFMSSASHFVTTKATGEATARHQPLYNHIHNHCPFLNGSWWFLLVSSRFLGSHQVPLIGRLICWAQGCLWAQRHEALRRLCQEPSIGRNYKNCLCAIIHTYITLHYVTLRYVTSHHITSHYIHTYITYIYIFTYLCKCICICKCKCKCICICICMYIYIYIYIYTYMCVCVCMNLRIRNFNDPSTRSLLAHSKSTENSKLIEFHSVQSGKSHIIRYYKYIPWVAIFECKTWSCKPRPLDFSHDVWEQPKKEQLLSSSDPHPETLFWHSFWHTIRKYIWHIYSDILSDFLSGSFWHLFWHTVWHIFWQLSGVHPGKYSDILLGILSGIFSDIITGTFSGTHSGIFCGIYSDILSDILSGILSGICFEILFGILSDNSLWHSIWHSLWLAEARQCPLRSGAPVEVRRCPLSSGARGWGPEVPTEIWRPRLRSAGAHRALDLAVEAQQCPLRSGARSWGPAEPSEMLTSGGAHWDLALAVEVLQCPLRSGARNWARRTEEEGRRK